MEDVAKSICRAIRFGYLIAGAPCLKYGRKVASTFMQRLVRFKFSLPRHNVANADVTYWQLLGEPHCLQSATRGKDSLLRFLKSFVFPCADVVPDPFRSKEVV